MAAGARHSSCEDLRERAMLEAARQAASQAEERLRLALDAAKVGAWDFDPRTREIVWDHRCRAIYGIDLDTAIDLSAVFEQTHPEDKPIVSATLETVFERANSAEVSRDFALEHRILRFSDGSVRWISLRGCVYFEDEGAVRIIGTMVDNTELEAVEHERARLLERERVARAEAELANRVKDEFLATVSHELRTPLNAILGWTTILSSPNVEPARMRKGLEIIQRNASAQAKIIEDILDVSRVMAGKLKLERRSVDLVRVATDAMDAVRPAAEAKSLTLSCDVDSECLVQGDPDRLQQVVWNLLSNAVKFTESEGRIHLSVRQDAEVAWLSVEDTGCGIDPEFLPNLFERFRQADSSKTRKFGGLGLGLAIVRQLVELHGGRVNAFSDGAGTGARFVIELPLRSEFSTDDMQPRSLARLSVVPSEGGLAGVRIFVVEDELDAREFLVMLLNQEQANVRSAGNVPEALRALAEEPCDVLVSDIGLPEEDGYALIRRLRARTDGLSRVPAIALTAYARESDRSDALNAGFDVHLAKPVDLTRLLSTIRSLLSERH